MTRTGPSPQVTASSWAGFNDSFQAATDEANMRSSVQPGKAARFNRRGEGVITRSGRARRMAQPSVTRGSTEIWFGRGSVARHAGLGAPRRNTVFGKSTRERRACVGRALQDPARRLSLRPGQLRAHVVVDGSGVLRRRRVGVG